MAGEIAVFRGWLQCPECDFYLSPDALIGIILGDDGTIKGWKKEVWKKELEQHHPTCSRFVTTSPSDTKTSATEP